MVAQLLDGIAAVPDRRLRELPDGGRRGAGQAGVRRGSLREAQGAEAYVRPIEFLPAEPEYPAWLARSPERSRPAHPPQIALPANAFQGEETVRARTIGDRAQREVDRLALGPQSVPTHNPGDELVV